MPTLEFDLDWVDAEGIRGPELASTWAAFRIRLGDSTITRALDERAKTTREFLFLPLYPLAEWLATNWWFLSHEFKNPNKSTDADFHERHSLAAGREGYALPNLDFVSWGSITRLTWRTESLPWARVTFLEQGEAWVDTEEFRASCAGLVDRVIRRLDALGIEKTFLQQEWAAIQMADDEEMAFCATAAGLGWDPYALDDARRNWVIWLSTRLGDMLGEAVPAMVTPDDYDEWQDLARAVAEAKKFNRIPLRCVHMIDRDDFQVNMTGIYPWIAGYAAARHMRRVLDLDQGDPLPTLSHIAQALQEDARSIERVTDSQKSFVWPNLVDAVVAQDDEGPAFAFRWLGKLEEARRFHFCRALAEVLFSPGSDALLTKAHTERQMRNRAFAAEFLAPSKGLGKRVRRKVVDNDDLNELAAEYGVSARLIEQQLRAHRIAEIWDG